jgi:hypothetical protein
MATDDEARQIHSTVGADLPDDVRGELPERFKDAELVMAEDPMNATVENANQKEVPLVDEAEGEVYVVTLQEITWNQVNQALTDALVPSTSGDGKLDFGTYYRQVAKAKIVDTEPGVPEEQLAQWLTGVKEGLGKQLQQHLPDPVDDIEEQEAKN